MHKFLFTPVWNPFFCLIWKMHACCVKIWNSLNKLFHLKVTLKKKVWKTFEPYWRSSVSKGCSSEKSDANKILKVTSYSKTCFKHKQKSSLVILIFKLNASSWKNLIFEEFQKNDPNFFKFFVKFQKIHDNEMRFNEFVKLILIESSTRTKFHILDA